MTSKWLYFLEGFDQFFPLVRNLLCWTIGNTRKVKLGLDTWIRGKNLVANICHQDVGNLRI